MYLYHVTSNEKIRLISQSQTLNGYNWSAAFRDNPLSNKHIHLEAEEKKLTSKNGVFSESIYRICAWVDEQTSIDECAKYNRTYSTAPQSSVLRFEAKHLLEAGFTATVDDRAKVNGFINAAHQYWIRELNIGEHSSVGVQIKNVDILSNGLWVKITPNFIALLS